MIFIGFVDCIGEVCKIYGLVLFMYEVEEKMLEEKRNSFDDYRKINERLGENVESMVMFFLCVRMFLFIG